MHFSGFIRTVALNLLGLLVMSPAPAQEKPREEVTQEQDGSQPETPAPYQEQVYVEGSVDGIPDFSTTWAKMPVALQTTPATVGVVPRFVFESQNGHVLGDALKNVSGVNVTTGFGVFDFFVIRGFDSLDTSLVLTDGAFEPETTFYHLYNVARVEVLKGPGAFLYGGNPLSGTVNLVRKQPMAGNFAQIQAGLGRFQSYHGAVDFNLSRSDGSAAFRMNGFYRESEFYRDDKDNHLFAVNPSLSVRLDDETSLTVNFEYVTNEYRPDSGLPLLSHDLPDVPRTRSYQSPLDISDQEIYRLRVDLASEINDRLILRNKLYITDLDWRSNGTLLLGSFPNLDGGVDVFRSLLLLDDRQKLVGNQLEALLSFETGAVEHRILAGFETMRVSDEFTLDVGLLPTIDLFHPVETTPKRVFVIPGQSTAADARALVFAPYFVDQISLTEKLDLFAGGRWDVLDYEDPVSRTVRDSKNFSPMVGVVLSLRPDLSFYASSGRAFAPPSSRVAGERKPEESWQFEIGVKKRLPVGRVAAAFYHLERNDIGIPDATGFTQQAGSQRSRGVELELAVEALTEWFTFASYAFNDSQLTEFAETLLTGSVPPFVILDRSGNTAPFAPRHILRIWTHREFPSGLGVGAGARYVSGQFIAPDNGFEIDGYTTLEATVSYRLKHWRWSLNFKNLTDRDYESRGFGSSSVIPGDPFVVYAGVEFKLGS
ncbi:MAG: TonB-dependent receptor [Acidobacteriota bacterium]